MTCTRKWLLFITFILSNLLHFSTNSGRVTIKVNKGYSNMVLQGLKGLNFRLLYKITPTVYIVEYDGNEKIDRAVELLRRAFQDQIIEVETVREYKDTFKHYPTISDEADILLTTIVCSQFYDKNVPKAWERNITGNNVTMAVTDLGAITDLMEMRENASNKLCGNVLTNIKDVTPENMLDMMDGESSDQDRRNNVTSLFDIKMNNNTCGARIAYDATFVGMTINKTEDVENRRTTSQQLSAAFADALDKIDICVNAWAPTRPFDHLDLTSWSVIKYGATKGRHGLGTIFVVPAGSLGNELSNNIYTISVNSIGRYGTKPYEVMMDASVLISGLRDLNNSTVLSTIAPPYDKQCVTTFKGPTAPVLQVTGIIALGLQANPKLTLRDVQHLLVDAAENYHLGDTMAFKINGASKYFHHYFGFGLLNADKFVRLAQIHKPVPVLRSWILDVVKSRISGSQTHIYEFHYSCDVYSEQLCLINIEHVQATVNFTLYDEHIKMEVISPDKTKSIFIDSDMTQEERPFNKKINLVSVHFWDEVAFGKWYIRIQSKNSLNTQVHNISLTLYGTMQVCKDKSAASCMASSGSVEDRNNFKDKEHNHHTVNLRNSPKSNDQEVPLTLIFISFSLTVFCICLVFCAVKFCKVKVQLQFDNSLRENLEEVELSLVDFAQSQTDKPD